ARHVRQPHRALDLVDVLPAGAAGAEDVDPDVLRVDLHIDLFDLGQYRDGRGRRVDPPLGLGCRNPLDAVDATLELQTRVGAASADLEHDLFKAADADVVRVDDVDVP